MCASAIEFNDIPEPCRPTIEWHSPACAPVWLWLECLDLVIARYLLPSGISISTRTNTPSCSKVASKDRKVGIVSSSVSVSLSITCRSTLNAISGDLSVPYNFFAQFPQLRGRSEMPTASCRKQLRAPYDASRSKISLYIDPLKATLILRALAYSFVAEMLQSANSVCTDHVKTAKLCRDRSSARVLSYNRTLVSRLW